MTNPWPDIEFPVEGAKERYEMYLQLSDIAVKMKKAGWAIDGKRAEEHRAAAVVRAQKYKNTLRSCTGLSEDALGNAGVGQTQAMRDYFWKELKAPVVVVDKKSKKPQLNQEALIIYANDYTDEPLRTAAAALYGLRKNLKSAEYCTKYLQFAPRVHIDFNPGGTKGERWSSSGAINVQQVPSREPTFEFEKDKPEKLVHSLRDIFIADSGCVLIKSDFDQLEPRILAYTADAKKLIEWTKDDLHMQNAIHLFVESKIPKDAKKVKKYAPGTIEEVIYKAREAAKPLTLGFTYQMPIRGKPEDFPKIYKQLKKIFPNVDERYVRVLAKRFFELHPEVRALQWEVTDNIAKNGFQSISVNKARLYLPNIARGRNQAINFIMQSPGGVFTNRAIIELDKRLNWAAGEQIRAQVHDELVVQAPIKSAEKVAKWVEECMGAPAQIGKYFVGIPAGADIGWNWGHTMSRKQFWEQYDGQKEAISVGNNSPGAT